MSQASVTTEAKWIANVAVDSTRLDNYYNEALIEVAGSTEVNISIQQVAIAIGVDTYTFDALFPDTVQVLACFARLGVNPTWELLRTSLTQLDAQSRTWRNDTGTPNSWFLQNEPHRQIRLYPTPNGGGFLDVFVTDKQDIVPKWLDYPLAFAILRREFARSSPQYDPAFVQLCEQAGSLFRSMGGPP